MANHNLSSNQYSQNDHDRELFAIPVIFSRTTNIDCSTSRPVELKKCGVSAMLHYNGTAAS